MQHHSQRARIKPGDAITAAARGNAIHKRKERHAGALALISGKMPEGIPLPITASDRFQLLEQLRRLQHDAIRAHVGHQQVACARGLGMPHNLDAQFSTNRKGE